MGPYCNAMSRSRSFNFMEVSSLQVTSTSLKGKVSVLGIPLAKNIELGFRIYSRAEILIAKKIFFNVLKRLFHRKQKLFINVEKI